MPSNSDTFSEAEVAKAVAMMVVVILIGTIGNTLVITILCLKKSPIGSRWSRRRRQIELRENGSITDAVGPDWPDRTLDFFILVLAVSDLLVCILIIPSTIIMELIEFRITIDFICKLYYVVFVTNTTFSSLIISAVALDRYLFICHPLNPCLTLLRAKMLVSLLAVFSLVVGIGAGVVVHVRRAPSPTNTTGMDNKEFPFICEEIEFTPNITEYQRIFSLIVKRVNHVCYLVCIIVVFMLYSFVFLAIVTTHTRNAKRQARNQEQQPQQRHQRGTLQNTHTGNTGNGSISRQRVIRLSTRFFQGAQFTLQNIRSALMLFVIAMVYILTYVPALLFANGWAEHNLVLLYLGYVNSAANPCIYAAFTPSFRRVVVLLFKYLVNCCKPRAKVRLSADGQQRQQPMRGQEMRIACTRPSSWPFGRKRSNAHVYPFVTREQRMASESNPRSEVPADSPKTPPKL